MNALNLSPAMQTAVYELTEVLLQAKAIVDYQQAKVAYDADTELQALIKEYLSRQQKLRSRISSDSVTEDELDHLRKLQRQVQINPLVMNMSMHQQAASFLLEDVIAGLNQITGIDFAVFANPSSC